MSSENYKTVPIEVLHDILIAYKYYIYNIAYNVYKYYNYKKLLPS